MPVLTDWTPLAQRNMGQILSSTDDRGSGNTFICTMSGNIYSARFYCYKVGGPTGTATAKLYSVSGTTVAGVDGKPGTALQTSSGIDVTTMTDVWPGDWVEFRFAPTGSGYMDAGTHYFISLEYSGAGSGVYIVQGHEYASPNAPVRCAADNYADSSDMTNWYASTVRVAVFEVYVEPSNIPLRMTPNTTATLTRSAIRVR